jgi:hypothetical protein
MGASSKLVQNDGDSSMAYQQGKGEQICLQREAARDAVSKAKAELTRGGPVSAVNKAERALLDAIDAEYEFRSGR